MRGRSWEALGQSEHQKLEWSPGKSGVNMGQRLCPQGEDAGASGFRNRGPAVGPWDRGTRASHTGTGGM